VAISALVVLLNPTVDELNDIKTAVSEAVTNAIIHGYDNKDTGKIFITCKIQNNEITIEVRDCGVGMDDIAIAMTPMYTSKPNQERTGIGFTVMETFMDKVIVKSKKNLGTKVIMIKKISNGN
jgi:stage II sporulation protein AB (anti-sigma F factor)